MNQEVVDPQGKVVSDRDHRQDRQDGNNLPPPTARLCEGSSGGKNQYQQAQVVIPVIHRQHRDQENRSQGKIIIVARRTRTQKGDQPCKQQDRADRISHWYIKARLIPDKADETLQANDIVGDMIKRPRIVCGPDLGKNLNIRLHLAQPVCGSVHCARPDESWKADDDRSKENAPCLFPVRSR